MPAPPYRGEKNQNPLSMGKSKPDKRLKKRKKVNPKDALHGLSPIEQAQVLLDEATNRLQTGEPEQALTAVQKSLQCLSGPSTQAELRLPAMGRLAEIYIELGEAELARETFLQAAKIDPSGDVPEVQGGGADKFLWLAQLSEEGGTESVGWFDKGIAVLRRQVVELEQDADANTDPMLEERKDKLANALCGAAEVYMTDLSWEEDAEARCEALVTEACLVAPQSPEPLQTLASVRISQTRFADARAALNRSLELWTSLPPEDPNVPAFPTRISLARLLMEVELEEQALSVLERLVSEDDSSIEAWYLGGWCLHLLGNKSSAPKNNEKQNGVSNDTEEARKQLLSSSRDWLQNSLRLYSLLDYEDDRLREHSEELVHELNTVLGPPDEKENPSLQGDEDVDEDEWEDEDDADSNGDETDAEQEMSGT